MHGRLRGSALTALLVSSCFFAGAPADNADQDAVLLTFASQVSNFQARLCSLKVPWRHSVSAPPLRGSARLAQAVLQDNQLQGWGQSNASACGLQQSISEPAQQCSPTSSLYRPATHNPWTGVSCDANGEVVCLALPGCGLAVPFDAIASLAQLSHLAYLDLDQNALTGTVPLGLGGNLSVLQVDGVAFLGKGDFSWSERHRFL